LQVAGLEPVAKYALVLLMIRRSQSGPRRWVCVLERAGHVHEAWSLLGSSPLPAPSPLALSPSAQKSTAGLPSCQLRWVYLQLHRTSVCRCCGPSVLACDPCLTLMACDLCALGRAGPCPSPGGELTLRSRIGPHSRGTRALGREEQREGGAVFLSSC